MSVLNFYVYTDGDPVNFVDRTGLKINVYGSNDFKIRVFKTIYINMFMGNDYSIILQELLYDDYNYRIIEIFPVSIFDSYEIIKKKLSHTKTQPYMNGNADCYILNDDRYIDFLFDYISNGSIIRLYVEYYSTLESNLAHELAHVWAIKNLNISLDKEEDFATYIQRFIGDYPKESKKY